MCFFSNVGWGLFLIIVGFVVLLNAIFNLHIPIFKIMFALLLVSMGIKMLLSTRHREFRFFSCNRFSQEDAAECSSGCCFSGGVFSDTQSTQTINGTEYVRHSIAFGKKIIDLTGDGFVDRNVIVEVDASFGEITVKIDSRMPVGITAHTSFGSFSLPETAHLVFDKGHYRTVSYENATKKIDLDIRMSFGAVHIMDVRQDDKK